MIDVVICRSPDPEHFFKSPDRDIVSKLCRPKNVKGVSEETICLVQEFSTSNEEDASCWPVFVSLVC